MAIGPRRLIFPGGETAATEHARTTALPLRRSAVTVGLTLLALTSVAATQETQWPRFRGLAAGAIADDPALPDTWGETENVVWKAHIPGLG